ncbi:MAG: hypothetical protein V3V00_12180 [Saprospiraceae bacterium]
MKKIILSVIIVLIGVGTSAQTTKVIDAKKVIVYLKNGSIMSGTLVSWKYGEEVIINTQGTTITFPDDKVRKVMEQNNAVKIKMPILHIDKGLYYTAKAQLLTGNGGNRAHNRVGYGITASVGYQWSQYLAVGVGAGYRQFIWDTGEEMIPIFAEVKGFVNSNNIRPFYSLELGYAFNWTDEDLQIIETKGGLSIYPAIGLSFGRTSMKYTIDLGYLFQNAEITYSNSLDDRIRTTQDITYKRLTFRFGVNF